MEHHLEEAAIQQLLAKSVETLCMSTLTYQDQITIEGIVGIRVDGTHVLLIKLDQSVKRDGTATFKGNVENKGDADFLSSKGDGTRTRTSNLNILEKRQSAETDFRDSGGSVDQMVSGDVETCDAPHRMEEVSYLKISNDNLSTTEVARVLDMPEYADKNLDTTVAAEVSSLRDVTYDVQTAALPMHSGQENILGADIVVNIEQKGEATSSGNGDTGSQELEQNCKGRGRKGLMTTRGKFTEHFSAVTKDGKVVKYTCKKCPYEAKKKYCMQRHMSTHGMFLYLCSECGKPMSDAIELKDHVRFVHNNQVLQCPVCQQTFRSRQGFYQHQVIHNEQKHNGAYCVICQKQFSAVGSFRMHQRVKHQGETHTCSYCNKIFKYKTGLKGHLQTCLQNPESSSTIPLHSCAICDKQYRRTSTLREHLQRVHGGQQNFKCQKCGECLSSRSALVRHKKKNTCQEGMMKAELAEVVDPETQVTDVSHDLAVLTNVKEEVQSVEHAEENFHQTFFIISGDEQLVSL